jgi:hypothetical protein
MAAVGIDADLAPVGADLSPSRGGSPGSRRTLRTGETTMKTFKLSAAIVGLALGAFPAGTTDFASARIDDLRTRGYTHFEVSRGAVTTEIDAYGANLVKLELEIANADGALIRETTELQSEAERARDIAEIARGGGFVLEDADDDTKGHGTPDGDDEASDDDAADDKRDDGDEAREHDGDDGDRDGDDEDEDDEDDSGDKDDETDDEDDGKDRDDD